MQQPEKQPEDPHVFLAEVAAGAMADRITLAGERKHGIRATIGQEDTVRASRQALGDASCKQLLHCVRLQQLMIGGLNAAQAQAPIAHLSQHPRFIRGIDQPVVIVDKRAQPCPGR
jgi:hypothetical protein